MSRTYHETIRFEVEAETAQAALALAYEREDAIAFDWEQITESEREVRAIYSSTGERVYSADEPDAGTLSNRTPHP
jgi:hypothetical protein